MIDDIYPGTRQLKRTHARAASGIRAYDTKPFYRGEKVSVIGAISISKVLAVMTLKHSMDSATLIEARGAKVTYRLIHRNSIRLNIGGLK